MADIPEYATLTDVISRLDSKGEIAPIAEVLTLNNAILRRLRWKECNMVEGYKHSIRTGIPEPTWRGLYEGVQPTKSTTASVTDVTSNLEMTTQVDCDLADINGNTYQWRLTEQRPSMEGMSNAVAKAMYYGDNDADIRKFTGLATRYNTLDPKVPCSKNVVNAKPEGYAGGQSGFTSAFIVNLEQFIGLYPKGSMAGLRHTDMGKSSVDAPNGKGKMLAYTDWYKWQVGAALIDWRGCVRVCNIPIKDGVVDLDADVLIKTLIKAKNRIPPSLRRNLVMFCPTELYTALETAAYDKSSSVVKIVEAAEQFRTNFFNIPLEADDAISLEEAEVKAA